MSTSTATDTKLEAVRLQIIRLEAQVEALRVELANNSDQMARETKCTVSPDTVDLIVYDFDGVMTDNRVLVTQNGVEAVWANRSDGLGVQMVRNMGLRQLILSTETNPVVQARAEKLKLEVIRGSADKVKSLSEFCDAEGIDLRRVLYVGNDLNDLDVMAMVGSAVAPADAHPAIIAIAQAITTARGGEGVIRELGESILVR